MGKCAVETVKEMPRLDQLPGGRTCVQPFNELQGGYNGVLVDKRKRVVQFVHVTTARQHSFKLSFFLQSLQALGVPEKNRTAGEALDATGDPAGRGWE
eukprot:756815-Hanusia_phi.AAC.2